MSEQQDLPITPLIIGVAGIVIGSSFIFYFLNRQPSPPKERTVPKKSDLPIIESKPKEVHKHRIKKKNEIPQQTPIITEQEIPKQVETIIKEEPKPQMEPLPSSQVKDDFKEENKKVNEDSKQKKKKNKKPKNKEQNKQEVQTHQKQTLLQDMLIGNDEGEWEEVVKYKKTDKEKSKKLQEKLKRQHDEYLSQF